MAVLGLAFPDYLAHIAVRVAVLHATAGTLIPLFVSCMLTGFFGKNRSFGEGLRVWKFALFAAFAMTVPYVCVAVLLGPEFPALLGGLIGLGVVTFAARKGFLLPKDPWDFGPRSEWESEWMGNVDPAKELAADRPTMGIVRAWLPYVLVAVVLVVSRIPWLGLQPKLAGVKVGLAEHLRHVDHRRVPAGVPPWVHVPRRDRGDLRDPWDEDASDQGIVARGGEPDRGSGDRTPVCAPSCEGVHQLRTKFQRLWACKHAADPRGGGGIARGE